MPRQQVSPSSIASKVSCAIFAAAGAYIAANTPKAEDATPDRPPAA